MFHHNPLLRQPAVFLLLLWCQGMMFTLFVGSQCFLMLLAPALVTTVSQTLSLRQQRQLALLQKPKVMGFARSKGQGDQAFIRFPQDELSFGSVALFLTTVVLFLFF